MTKTTKPSFVKEAEAEERAVSSRRRLAVMDGLRGVAALLVVLYHSYKGGGLVPNAPLAVDLFFVLSGFVIAYSYDHKLGQPGGTRRFLGSRFVRLYPMLFLGAVGGIALAIVHNFISPGEAYSYRAIATSGVLSIFALPYLDPTTFPGQAFSFNPVIWSLFFEIVANLLYAASQRFLTVPVLVVVTALGVIGVALLGPLGGGDQVHFLSGFPRVTAGFFGGILLFKLWRAGHVPAIKGNIFALSVVLLALLAIPTQIGGWVYLPALLILLAIVASSINAPSSRADGWCEFLGLISYPIYLIHWLTIYVFTFVGMKVGLTGDLYVVVVIANLVAIPFIGYAVARYYETPARLALRRLMPNT